MFKAIYESAAEQFWPRQSWFKFDIVTEIEDGWIILSKHVK